MCISMNFIYVLFNKRRLVYVLTAEESWVLFNCKILPDFCSCWSSVKGSAGNRENLYKFEVLNSQATCFSKVRCTL